MERRKIVRLLKHPSRMIPALGARGFLKWLSDETYLKKCFKSVLGYDLNLENPQSFNEKLQWLKLHDRNPLYVQLVDKYAVRAYVEGRLGDGYLIPLAGGPWDSFEEIDFSRLPNRFVLKCTHDSGSVFVVKDKGQADLPAIRAKIERALKRNFYWACREWPYKNVPPRIIAEEYVELDSSGCAEYKLFCYGGRVNWAMVCRGIAHDPAGGRTNDGFDQDFNHLPVEFTYPNSKESLAKPAEWDEMKSIAERLSEGIPQVRVDLYCLDGVVYVGEMTFYHDAGCCDFKPKEWDAKFGEDLVLPERRRS